MTIVPSAVVMGTAAAPAWSRPVRAAQYDRCPALSVAERAALDILGWDVRCWTDRWEDPGLPQWHALRRLVLPLAQAAESLEVVDDWFHRRSARDAVACFCEAAPLGERASGPGTRQPGRGSSESAERLS